jgi:hypothetical protein
MVADHSDRNAIGKQPDLRLTGLPAFNARLMASESTGSTPITWTLVNSGFEPSADTGNQAPPPTGTKIAARSCGCCHF